MRSIRALAVLIAFSLLAIPARAADKAGATGDLIGTWTLTGPDVGGKVTMEFAAPDQLTVVRIEQSKNGDAQSRGLGPEWKLADKKLTFTGSMSTNDFEIKGSWALAWEGPDKLTATAARGKKYRLERVTAARPADTPADKAAVKPAAPSAADLLGTWTVAGPGVDSGKLTMEFDAPDRLTVVRLKSGDTGTLSPGPQWKLSGNKLAFSDTPERGQVRD
jgi:hypothetical protein